MSQQLIEDYLTNGGTITVLKPASLDIVKHYTGPLKTTEPSKEFDSNGNRVYTYLNKSGFGQSIDPTTFNYGD